MDAPVNPASPNAMIPNSMAEKTPSNVSQLTKKAVKAHKMDNTSAIAIRK